MQETTPSDLTLLRKSSPRPPQLDPAWDVVCGCQFGHYPWDDWERWALSRGLDPDIAGQARLLIREWFNHQWPKELQAVCGWSDDGQGLLKFGKRSPKEALAQWEILMRTDGLRGDYWGREWEWTWGYLQPDAERLLARMVSFPEPRTHNPEP